MKREQIKERIDVHGHDTVLSTLLVHLVIIRDMSVCNIENPVIGDGHAIGIAPDVLEHLTDTFGRWLGIYDPRLGKAFLAYSLGDDGALLLQPSGQKIHETPSELAAHSSHGEEERRPPATIYLMPFAIGVNASTGYNAVDMGVIKEIRSPRMEDGCHSSLKPLSCCKSINSAPCGLEHTIVELPLIGHRNGMQTIRQRKDDMEVLGRDNLFPAELNPLLTLLVLALGTMSVTTAVIADVHIPALGTLFDMASKGTGPAEGHVSKSSSDSSHDLMLRKELISMTSDNLTNVKFGPHRLGGYMVSISRTCFIGSMFAI